MLLVIKANQKLVKFFQNFYKIIYFFDFTAKNWKKILLTGKFLYHIKKRLSRTVLAKLKEFHYILLQEDYDENLWQNKVKI